MLGIALPAAIAAQGRLQKLPLLNSWAALFAMCGSDRLA
jgi:hypothetical protein